jgi:hypothetical protein
LFGRIVIPLELQSYPYSKFFIGPMIRLFWRKLRAFWSAEIPSGIAACEFDCRETNCPTEDFLTCPNRLQKELALKALAAKNSTEDLGDS